MKNFLIGLVLALSGGLSGCTPISGVNVEQRDNVNFSKYRTFDFADTQVKTNGNQNPLLRSPIAQDRIKQVIGGELTGRGLRQVDNKPDLFITTHTYVEEAERTVYRNTYPGAGFAYPYSVGYRGAYLPINYGYWYSPAYYQRPYYQQPHTEQYTQGTLIIDFIDRRTNNLVWRGSLADPLNDPGRLGSEFSVSAKDILDQFPIKVK
jgi:hypothetical protein